MHSSEQGACVLIITYREPGHGTSTRIWNEEHLSLTYFDAPFNIVACFLSLLPAFKSIYGESPQGTPFCTIQSVLYKLRIIDEAGNVPFHISFSILVFVWRRRPSYLFSRSECCWAVLSVERYCSSFYLKAFRHVSDDCVSCPLLTLLGDAISLSWCPARPDPFVSEGGDKPGSPPSSASFGLALGQPGCCDGNAAGIQASLFHLLTVFSSCLWSDLAESCRRAIPHRSFAFPSLVLFDSFITMPSSGLRPAYVRLSRRHLAVSSTSKLGYYLLGIDAICVAVSFRACFHVRICYKSFPLS